MFKGTVLYLVRVPVAVKDDNSVSRLQVQPQTSCSGAQQEDEVLKRRIIKVLQQHATILSLSGSYKDKRKTSARLDWLIVFNEPLISRPFWIWLKQTHHPSAGIWSCGRQSSPPWWSWARSSDRRAALCGWWRGASAGCDPAAQTYQRHGTNQA